MLILSTGLQLNAQTIDTTSRILKEVTVTGYQSEKVNQSPMNVSIIKLDSLRNFQSFTLCDVLKKMDGVTVLSSGNGIVKPVIRGLYGNRILILLNGLKFDNQQWQEEHGLGLSSIGLSKIELIKGPIGTLYGTEAIGGVINLLEEEKPKTDKKVADLSLTYNSNTNGGQLQAGYLESKGNKWWRLRIGTDNHADYTDGNNQRILNSRFDGYYLKSTYGFTKNKWTSTTNYSFAFNRFGFINNDTYTFINPDNRWSRSLSNNPAHLVLLNLLSNENRIIFSPKWKLSVNLGIQSNKRMENEGGGNISLNMHLITLQGLGKVEYTLNDKHKFIFSTYHSWANNTNYGARKIVPNAIMQESNLSVNYEYQRSEKLIWEQGFGIGEKNITTFRTSMVNDSNKEIQPFSKIAPYVNLFSGVSFNPTQRINLKANLATGVRMANLAELSSDGLHEGVFTYEIGNPNLKNEQVYSANVFVTYELPKFSFTCSPFLSYFNHYIYLSPTAEKWFGFPVYRYVQKDVTQYGMEVSSAYALTKQLNLKVGYSGMTSKTSSGEYTPFIPAHKLSPQLNYKFTSKKKSLISCHTQLEYNVAHQRTAPLEKSTPAYLLWHAGIAVKPKSDKLAFSLTANNILNKVYVDHLSRFKSFGIYNMGRNFVVNCSYTF